MRRAFTLIELMIVVAIIAILAAIAIPNLMSSRREANESNAVAALKIYVYSQGVFKKGNSSARISTTHVQEYANPFTQLYTTSTTPPIDLIPPVFAQATSPAVGYQGYYFVDDSAKPAGSKYYFGLLAKPCIYPTSGLNVYYVNEVGVVFQKDLGSQAASDAATTVDLQSDTGWVVP